MSLVSIAEQMLDIYSSKELSLNVSDYVHKMYGYRVVSDGPDTEFIEHVAFIRSVPHMTLLRFSELGHIPDGLSAGIRDEQRYFCLEVLKKIQDLREKGDDLFLKYLGPRLINVEMHASLSNTVDIKMWAYFGKVPTDKSPPPPSMEVSKEEFDRILDNLDLSVEVNS